MFTKILLASCIFTSCVVRIQFWPDNITVAIYNFQLLSWCSEYQKQSLSNSAPTEDSDWSTVHSVLNTSGHPHPNFYKIPPLVC